jgi:hypothetical protein
MTSDAERPPADLPRLPFQRAFGQAFSAEDMVYYARLARADLAAEVESFRQEFNSLMVEFGGKRDGLMLEQWVHTQLSQRDERIGELEQELQAERSPEIGIVHDALNESEARVRELEREVDEHLKDVGDHLELRGIAEKERDALRAQIEAIRKMPTVAWTRTEDGLELYWAPYEEHPEDAIELIERPELK